MSKYHQPNTIRVTEVELIVHNLELEQEFYLNRLGMHLLSNEPQKSVLSLDGIQPFLTLIEESKALKRGKTTGLYHFAILLPSRKDLGIFLRHVIKNQIPIGGAADHGVSEAIYLSDPEGNGIEIYADKPDSVWHDEFNSLVMVTEELDYTGIYYSAEDTDVFDKLPANTVLGHLHLSVSSLDKAKTFHVQALGFHVTLDTFPQALFTGNSGYHHHLGLNTWMGSHNPPSGSIGLKSYTITYPDCDAIHYAMKSLEALKYPILEIDFGYQTHDFDGNTVNLKIDATQRKNRQN
jgi:catechol 2,3-dioxygenase